MFGEGARRLIDALPEIETLDRPAVRRLLSEAWLEAVAVQDFEVATAASDVVETLRRLATALQVRIFVGTTLAVTERRACAFVAAEALSIARDSAPEAVVEPEFIAFGSPQLLEAVEEALLYLAAGFDSNAALTANEFQAIADYTEAAISTWVLQRLRSMLDGLRAVPEDAPPALPDDLRLMARYGVWRRIGELVEAHVRWLRMVSNDDPGAAAALRELAAMLQPGEQPAAHADLHHLALLVAETCEDTSSRALRRVPPPPGDDGRFAQYQRARARRRPLLWPAAERYAADALPGPQQHAVVAVPTGAGKSSVAELAAAQALEGGWVLYLAPTNALVAQIRRDLSEAFTNQGVAVVGLTGGAEYSVIDTDTLQVLDRQIAVMTPEKCSLALRQSPELFATLRLCVMDEAHLIGEAQSRGVVAELVLAEILHRAPDVRVLLLSALVDSPDELAAWLTAATGLGAVGIDEPWRPTRTLRALCGVADELLRANEQVALAELSGLPAKRKTVGVDVPLRLLGALQGTWMGNDRGDYAIVDTGISAPGRVERRGRLKRTDHTGPVTRKLTDHLASTGHRLLVFLPADRHAPFSYAGQIDGPGPGSSIPEVESLLVLADAEIAGVGAGEVTAVRGALAKGVALHSSAMLTEEQRACEIAFERGAATVMMATGTLAQGLNLPATAVIIGGTHVGDARDANTPEGRARSKSQLLNAIGRAGRAQTAARSLAIVVPTSPVRVSRLPDIGTARAAAPWLADEDGSAKVESQLGRLIAGAVSGTVDLETMDVPEQAAFAFLSFTAESGDAKEVVARTLAVHERNAVDHAEQLTGALRELGRAYLGRTKSPAWIATAAHRAGIALPAASALQRHLRMLFESGAPVPDSVLGWADTIAWLLVQLEPEDRVLLLGDAVIAGTALVDLASAGPDARQRPGEVASATLRAWLTGQPLVEIGRVLHEAAEPIGVTRGKGNQLPRTLRFVRDGIEHALTTLAGAVLATVQTGAELDPTGPWNLETTPMRELSRLPVSMRYGASDAHVLALMQAGLRPRVVAHLAARIAPPIKDDDDGDFGLWAWRTLRHLESVEEVADHGAQDVLRAAAHVRNVL